MQAVSRMTSWTTEGARRSHRGGRALYQLGEYPQLCGFCYTILRSVGLFPPTDTAGKQSPAAHSRVQCMLAVRTAVTYTAVPVC